MPTVDDLPASIRTVVGDGPLEPVATRTGDSPHVFRSAGSDGDDVVVKVAPAGEGADELEAESARLAWLDGRVAAPELLAFERHDARAWLVTAALDGSPASEPHQLVDGAALATALAGAVRSVHDLDPATCPFDVGLAWRTHEAERRVASGRVDPARFEPAYQRYSPERLLSLWRASDGGAEDAVVVHGDVTLDNVLVDDGRVTGLVDWGRCGVADRYVDLALVARSLARVAGPDVVFAFFEAYGLDGPDLAKVDFYVLADEFF